MHNHSNTHTHTTTHDDKRKTNKTPTTTPRRRARNTTELPSDEIRQQENPTTTTCVVLSQPQLGVSSVCVCVCLSFSSFPPSFLSSHHLFPCRCRGHTKRFLLFSLSFLVLFSLHVKDEAGGGWWWLADDAERFKRHRSESFLFPPRVSCSALSVAPFNSRVLMLWRFYGSHIEVCVVLFLLLLVCLRCESVLVFGSFFGVAFC